MGDPKFWDVGVLPTSADTVFIAGGDTFRFFLDGSNESFTNRLDAGSLYYYDGATPQHLTIDVGNGAEFCPGNVYMGPKVEGSLETFDVHDGGVLNCAGLQVKGYSRFDIRAGGVWQTPNGCLFGQNYGLDTAMMDATITLNGGVWETGGSTWLGFENCWQTDRIALFATNSTVEVNGLLFLNDDSDFVFGPGTVVRIGNELTIDSGAHVLFDGAQSPRTEDFPNALWSVGVSRAINREAVLTVTGESVIRPVGFTVGWDPLHTGRVVVAGNAEVDLSLPSFSYDHTRFGLGGTGCLEIRDNGFFHSTSEVAGGIPVRFGINAGGYGVCAVSGGLYEYYGYGTFVGCSGSGLMDVSGGQVRASRICLGTEASETESAEFRQTGGVVTLADGGLAGNLEAAQSAHRSTVVLDGGVLDCGRLVSSNPSYASFSADGGTIRRSRSYVVDSDQSMIKGFGSFRLGGKGLFVDSNGADVTIEQPMTNDGCVRGTLTKVGSGNLTFGDMDYEVAQTVVAQGTLTVGAGEMDWATDVLVTNAAVFSLVGTASSVTLRSLAVTNGVLALDPGDKIYVTDKVCLKSLSIKFSSVPEGDAMDFLIAPGRLDEESARALRRAVFIDKVPGMHGSFEVAYDESSGMTTVRIGMKANRPLSSTVWHGTTDDWTDPEKWSDGVPTVAKAAAFTDDAALSQVTVPAGAAVGAFVFDGADKVLSGSSVVSFWGEEGSAALTVGSGHHEIDSALDADVLIPVSVGSGASLVLAKPILGGGLEKTGRGKLALMADNAFTYRPISLDGGMTSVSTAGALGTEADAGVRLGDGTLEFPEGDGSPLTLAQDFVLGTDGADRATVVKNERDVVLAKGVAPSTGVLMKRGKGRLTVKVKDGDVLANSNGNADYVFNASKVTLDADGTPPTSHCAAYTVVEGELAFESSVPGSHPSVVLDKTVASGIKTAVPSGVQPVLAFKDLNVDAHTAEYYLAVGCNEDDEARYPVMRLEDTELLLATLTVGRWAYATFGGPTLALTNSTLSAGRIGLTTSNGTTSPVRIRAKNSRLVCLTAENAIGVNGTLDCDVSGTYIGWDGHSGCLAGGGIFTGDQRWVFRAGSELAVGSISGLLENTTRRDFVFEDSTWTVGDNDLSLDSSIVLPNWFSVTTAGETGATINVGSGRVLSFAEVPLSGEGGLVKRGLGTVAFGPGMYGFSGKLVVEEGTVELKDAGVVAGTVIGGGDGRICNATFSGATIALDADQDKVPIFSDCVFTGSSKILLQGTPRKLSGIRVAAVSGTCQGLTSAKVKGWKGYRATIRQEDEWLVADVDAGGFALIIR